MVQIQKHILKLGQAPFSECLARDVRKVNQTGLTAQSAHFLGPLKGNSLVQWTHPIKTGEIEYAVTIGRTIKTGVRFNHQHALIWLFQPNDHSVSFHVEPSKQFGPCPLHEFHPPPDCSNELEPEKTDAVFQILARVPRVLPDQALASLDPCVRQDHEAKVSKLDQLTAYRIACQVYPELMGWLNSLKKP